MTSLGARITALTIAAVSLSMVQIPTNAERSLNSGSVVVTGSMTVARFDHGAALLPSGQVLVVGGIVRNGVMQPTAELFNPATGTFSQTSKPLTPRGWGVTATTLANGKVLVAGGSSGCDSPCYTATAELYDPLTNRFTKTGNMTVPRAGARALPLPRGDVLIVGGAATPNGDPLPAAELYDLSAGTFKSVGATHFPDPSQLLLLKNGLVLVVGASGADLYNPETKRFAPTGEMAVPRTKFGAALLPDGRVLIAGGQTGGPWGTRVTSTQIYDPDTGTFKSGPSLNLERFKLSKAVVALKNGHILIGGGAEQLEIFDPGSARFIPVGGTKLDGFCFSTATVLNDGRVLLAGGYAKPGGEGVNHAWIYQP